MVMKIRAVIAFAAALLSGADVAMAETPAQTPCRFQTPADLDASPVRWMGACPNGMAEGLGVIRGGAVNPYAFFAGRMQAGLPVDGLLMLSKGGWMVAVRFDARLHVVSSDGLHPEEDDRVFAQAHAAALETTAIFRKAGNSASADFYSRLAQQITDGRPE